MGSYLRCDSGLVITPTNFYCPHWSIVDENELLTLAIQHNLLSREDFYVLSAGCVAILLVAMGLRVILKMFFSSGVFKNEKS